MHRWGWRINALGAGVLLFVAAAIVLTARGAESEPTTRAADTSTSSSSSSSSSSAPSTTTTVPPTTTTAPPPPPTTAATTGAFCLGDSVMLGASSRYHGTLHMCGEVDAVVGRPLSGGIPVIQGRGSFPPTVIIHLGTNGTVTDAQLDGLLDPLAGVANVLLVNVQTNQSRSWEGSVNAELAEADAERANVELVDWRTASDGHSEYFTDGIHITASGAQAYADTIDAALVS